MAPLIPVTGDPEADRLLAENPLALLIGMLLDQQVPMEWAFKGPYTLKQRLGGLDAAQIAAMSPDAIDAVFRDKPAVHRFPGSMAKRTHALARRCSRNARATARSVSRTTLPSASLSERMSSAFALPCSLSFAPVTRFMPRQS